MLWMDVWKATCSWEGEAKRRKERPRRATRAKRGGFPDIYNLR